MARPANDAAKCKRNSLNSSAHCVQNSQARITSCLPCNTQMQSCLAGTLLCSCLTPLFCSIVFGQKCVGNSFCSMLNSRPMQHTWSSRTPAARGIRSRSMRGGEQGSLMLSLLPQGACPVPHTQQHIFKEGGALEANDSTIVRPHACLAVVWVLLTLYKRRVKASGCRAQATSERAAARLPSS